MSKYGIVAREEWLSPARGNEEGYPDATFCIALLNDDFTLAVDDEARRYTGVHMGIGRVFDDATCEILGFAALPLDTAIFSTFDTETEAVEYYITRYRNDTVELEQSINAQRELNRYIDDLQLDHIERIRRNRYWSIIAACMFVILIVVLLARLFILLGYR